jgi:single-stranded DNA-specific DHH superfamily exonuclease
MLSEKQVKEIREHLEKAQNPVIFFDNDCDGLMSFVMVRKFMERGKGVAVKSTFDESYFRKIEEFNSDYVFILDRPNVSKGFIKRVVEKGIPVVWIDHHDVPKKDLITLDEFDNSEKILIEDISKDLIFYFNPCSNSDAEPVSYLVYKTLGKKEFMWMSMIGCIADNFIPEFAKDFAKDYPELWKVNAKEAFDLLYNNDLGKIIHLLDFALKDRTTNVVAMLNFLNSVKSPFEILKEDSRNLGIHSRYKKVHSIYSKLIERAKKIARRSSKVIFFEYGGELSISANLSNELSYCFPGKVVVVAYVRGAFVNVSIRGPIDVRKIILDVLKFFPNATGGGHKNAVGVRISLSDLKKFKELFSERV